jgi:hypothetical protein
MSPHGGCLDSKRSTSGCTRKTWMSTPGGDKYARYDRSLDIEYDIYLSLLCFPFVLLSIILIQ